jgi:hypothetical protein
VPSEGSSKSSTSSFGLDDENSATTDTTATAAAQQQQHPMNSAEFARTALKVDARAPIVDH